MIFLELFLSFLNIGIFGFGGGYAMLSLIQNEVVTKHAWCTVEEFTDIVAISQMTPGPISINCATYIGYTTSGSALGSAVATLGVCTPSIILMLIGGYFFGKLYNNRYIYQVMRSLRSVIIGLILGAALMLMTKDNFIDFKSYIIFGAALLLVRFKVNPIFIIIICGIAGFLLY